MSRLFSKIGVLGAGQLGKMMCEAGLPYHLELHLLDKDHTFPAAPYTDHFHKGDFNNAADVYAFGKNLDVLSIEIESVHTGALRRLEKEGKLVFPQPHIIELIQDKGLQKDFYRDNDIPTAPYSNLSYADILTQVESGHLSFPFVQKARKGGYDGKGVSIVRSKEDLIENADSVVEVLAPIDHEISIIVARDQKGTIVSYDAVEMVFDPVGNLVDYLICPSSTSPNILERADLIAKNIISELEMVGLLAVEMFVTKSGEIWVNEVAPRPHNSGHHTIKNTSCSQYEMLLRILAGLPIMEPSTNMPAMMVNILGPTGASGVPEYRGLTEILKIEGIHLFLYGKTESRPFRKLGHWTITGQTKEELMEKAEMIKKHFKIEVR